MSTQGVRGDGEEEGRDAVQAPSELAAGQGRKPYHAPHLVVHGSVRELTLGGMGASPDAQNKQKSKKIKPPRPSEPSIKHNVARIGTHPLGIGLYLFEYQPGFGPRRRHFGVMADEVEQVLPAAVSRGPDGLRRVRHDLLGITDLAQKLVR